MEGLYFGSALAPGGGPAFTSHNPRCLRIFFTKLLVSEDLVKAAIKKGDAILDSKINDAMIVPPAI